MLSNTKIFILVSLLAFIPGSAFASITYSRDGGSTPSSPVTFHVNVTDATDLAGTTETFLCIDVQQVDGFTEFTAQIPGGFGVSNAYPFSLPNGFQAQFIQLYPSFTGVCDTSDWTADGAVVEGDFHLGSPILFTVTPGSSPGYDFSGLQIMETSTVAAAPGQLAAATKSGTDTGFPFAILVIALAIAFFALEALFALMPSNPTDDERERSHKK